MEPLRDDRVAPGEDTNPLVAYDSERERVREEISGFDNSADAGDAEEYAVPTEMLQEDMAAELELPGDFTAGRMSAFIADKPRRLLCTILLIATVCLVGVLVFARETFSVSEDLFIARGAKDVEAYYGIGHLETATQQLRPDYVYPKKREKRRLSAERAARGSAGAAEDAKQQRKEGEEEAAAESGGYLSDGQHARAPRGWNATMPPAAAAARRRVAAAGPHERITLVYERRGLGSTNVLSLRQLKTIHDFESELFEWSARTKTCWQGEGGSDASDGCVPMDSLLNYLYPRVVGEGEGEGSQQLYFDGRMAVGDDSECALPPFESDDLGHVLTWLTKQQRDGWLEDVTEADQAETAETSDGIDGAGNDGSGSGNGSAAVAVPSSRYLRSTLYLSASGVGMGQWYELATMLYHFSSHPFYKNWYVRLYYGGPEQLMNANLLVLLSYDLGLLVVALIAMGLYFRLYFGQWPLAALAAFQILLSFPIMYFFVLVVFGQHPLSAFAAASLWVVIGVSADNIFVLHETFSQSRLLRRRGRRCTDAERIEWTVRQAAIPLFFANATTAGSLFVNCLSKIKSIFQFGLCGGLLIFVNFGLVFVFFTATLLLEERGALSLWCSAAHEPDLADRERGTQARMLRLQSVHRKLWDHRTKVLAAYALLVLLLFPSALQVSPGADSSFTFSPDPAMQQIIARARLDPTTSGDAIFRSAEPLAAEPLPSLTLPVTADSVPTPSHYLSLLDGTYEPPPPPSAQGPVFAVLLSLLTGYDAGLLLLLGFILLTDRPLTFAFLQPPTHELSPVLIALSNGIAALCLVTSLSIGLLSLKLCDFSHEARVPIGETLGTLLLLHSLLFGR